MYVPKHLLRILRRDWDRRYNDLETHMLNVLSWTNDNDLSTTEFDQIMRRVKRIRRRLLQADRLTNPY